MLANSIFVDRKWPSRIQRGAVATAGYLLGVNGVGNPDLSWGGFVDLLGPAAVLGWVVSVVGAGMTTRQEGDAQ